MIIVVPSSDRLTACTATLGPIFWAWAKDRKTGYRDASQVSLKIDQKRIDTNAKPEHTGNISLTQRTPVVGEGFTHHIVDYNYCSAHSVETAQSVNDLRADTFLC